MIDTFKTVEDILEGLNFFDFSFFILGFSTFFTLMFFIKDLFDKTYEYQVCKWRVGCQHSYLCC